MGFLHFPKTYTNEELLLRQKYSKLRKTKKALKGLLSPKKGDVIPMTISPLKRPAPISSGRDAKDFAKKMILEGKIVMGPKAPNTAVFRRPLGLQRKLSTLALDSPRSPAASAAENQSDGFSAPSSPFDTLCSDSESEQVNSKRTEYVESRHGIPSPGSPAGNMLTDSTETEGEFQYQYQPFTPSNEYDHQGKYQGRPDNYQRRGSVSGDRGQLQHGHTVYVRGRHLDQRLCREMFGKIGTVIHVVLDFECAFVTFDRLEAAEAAIAELNGAFVGNGQIQVSFSRRQPGVKSELATDALATARWTALELPKQSLKKTHADKRRPIVYETEDVDNNMMEFGLSKPASLELSFTKTAVPFSPGASSPKKPNN